MSYLTDESERIAARASAEWEARERRAMIAARMAAHRANESQAGADGYDERASGPLYGPSRIATGLLAIDWPTARRRAAVCALIVAIIIAVAFLAWHPVSR